uniref:Uncharacterized protein n=1 Tax=Fagus sylvatica TaxID=28930 RepID=A0A2N9G956_FAGSY
MEAFTRLLHSRVQNSSYFQFHPRCKESQVTHLSYTSRLHGSSTTYLKESAFGQLKFLKTALGVGDPSIIKLRQEARHVLSFEVGDGRSISLPHDMWHPNGVLFQKYSHRVILIYDAASQFEAKIETVLREKQWVWKALEFCVANGGRFVCTEFELVLSP